MEKPVIFNPVLPYVGLIYGGRFAPRKLIRIQGTASGARYRFDINLQCGPKTLPRDDVAVQMSVELLDGYISLNSLHNGIWGEQYKVFLPIKSTEQFDIVLMCDSTEYQVGINDQHYYKFPQRIHYTRITHLAIDGDVSITKITYDPESDATGALSGGGIGSFSGARPTTPSLPSSIETENYDLEMADVTTRLVSGVDLASNGKFSQPPSYNEATYSNQGETVTSASSPLTRISQTDLHNSIPLNPASSNFTPITPLKTIEAPPTRTRKIIYVFLNIAIVVVLVVVGYFVGKSFMK